MGLFGKLFGKKQAQTEMWYMVAEWIRQGNIYLVGSRRTLEIEEAAFGAMLISAKISGWTGGNEFFIISGEKGVLRQFEDGMCIFGEEASELGIKFFEFTNKERNDWKGGNLDEDFLKICLEGGFSIEIP